MSRQKLGLIASAIFLVSFFWYLSLTQGLPAGDVDDWNNILRAKDREWSDLVPNLIRPWSKSKYWNAQTNRDYNRVGHDVILKPVASSQLGDTDFAYYLTSKAPFFAGIITIFFIMCFWLTQSVLYALLGTLFFSLIPAHYAHSLWLSDASTTANFCTILGISLAFLAFENIRLKRSFSSFLSILFLIHLIIWFGIRTKEPAVIGALVIGCYGFFYLKYWSEQKLKIILLFLSAAHLVFLMVPIEHLGSTSTVGTIPFEWNNIFRMVFKNYGSGYEDEPTIAFFSRSQIWPSSIARTFGFYLLWTIVIHIGVYLWNKVRKSYINSIFLGNSLVGMLIIWATFEIFFMGRFQTDPRYFSATTIPLTLLAVRIIYCAHQTSGMPVKLVLIAFSLFSTIWAAPYVNLQHTIWLRLQIGQRSHYFLETAKTMYSDLFPTERGTLREVGRFYCSSCDPAEPNQPKLDHYLYYWELPYESWSKISNGAIETFKEFAEKGYIYYVTFQLSPELERNPNIRYLSEINGINSGSIFEKVLYKLRRKFPRKLHVLKWQS